MAKPMHTDTRAAGENNAKSIIIGSKVAGNRNREGREEGAIP